MGSSGAKPGEKMASHGRGGAGNIAPTSKPPRDPLDMITPTIKTDTFPTGRGGSGNMAKNDPNDPGRARESQDVGPALRSSSNGPSHFGRGGAANTTRTGEVDGSMENNKGT